MHFFKVDEFRHVNLGLLERIVIGEMGLITFVDEYDEQIVIQVEPPAVKDIVSRLLNFRMLKNKYAFFMTVNKERLFIEKKKIKAIVAVNKIGAGMDPNESYSNIHHHNSVYTVIGSVEESMEKVTKHDLTT